MFPAMLMAHGDYVLPANVPANEFLNIEGKKLSTSRGWAVWLHEYLEEFPADLLRYALAATLPETKDADFSWSDFQARANSELADVLGNFVYRTMTFARRFADGVVPELEAPSDIDRVVLEKLSSYPEWIGSAYEAYRFREAVFETMALARLGNKYFNDTEPWKTRESDPQACANTIHVSLQICASLGVLLEPVLPSTAAAIRRMLRLEGVRASVPGGADGSIGWEEAGGALLPAGHVLGEEEILFTKIEDEVIEAQKAKLGSGDEAASDSDVAASDEPAFVPPKDLIEYDDFARLDLRAGVILEAEPLEKSKKLVRLVVDLGFEKRQILAGVKEHFSAEELVGRRVVVVANLAPRKMMGLESQGMVLMAENRDGSLHPIASTGEEGAVVL
jgi:methionyl-tRNA synthetase